MSAEHTAEKDALAATFADVLAAHAVDMSDEQKIDGEWVYGYCCDCGDFVPATGYNDHVARALVARVASLTEPKGADPCAVRCQHAAGVGAPEWASCADGVDRCSYYRVTSPGKTGA